MVPSTKLDMLPILKTRLTVMVLISEARPVNGVHALYSDKSDGNVLIALQGPDLARQFAIWDSQDQTRIG
jgi:hypothetical protein